MKRLTRHRVFWVGLLVAGTTAAEPAHGPPSTPPPAPAAPAQTPDCPNGRGSAIAELACEIAHALSGKVPGGALTVSAPLGSDVKPLADAKLMSRVTTVVAGALGVKSSTELATLSRARTLAAEPGTLVHLVLEIERGEIRLTADVYPVPKSFWDRVRDPEPNPSAHAFASRRLDAELRSFFPPVPLVAKHVDKATSDEQNPVALACGDVNGDGALELVLVGRSRVQMGRIRSSRFAVASTVSWTQLSPLSRAPLREPIGSAWIESGRFVDIGLSDRLEAVRLNGSFAAVAKLGHRLPWPGGGCAKIQGLGVRPEMEPCVASDGAARLARMDKPADAVAGALVPRRTGEARLVRAERVSNESTVVLRDDAGRSAKLEGAGAELAVGDLDGDGQPEVATSADTLEPTGDALVVSTWQDDGRVVERFRMAVPGGVHAIAICPAEGTGLAPLALAVPGELWVVR
jgi:hypothetical protein